MWIFIIKMWIQETNKLNVFEIKQGILILMVTNPFEMVYSYCWDDNNSFWASNNYCWDGNNSVEDVFYSLGDGWSSETIWILYNPWVDICYYMFGVSLVLVIFVVLRMHIFHQENLFHYISYIHTKKKKFHRCFDAVKSSHDTVNSSYDTVKWFNNASKSSHDTAISSHDAP